MVVCAKCGASCVKSDTYLTAKFGWVCNPCFHEVATRSEERPDSKPVVAQEAVNHPQHYGGADNPYEAIKVIEAWELGFCLGNTLKYVSRAGKKNSSSTLEDLKKARWYLDREIQRIERGGPGEA